MPVVKTTGKAGRQGKDGVQATTTRIGKGQQELRDIPQSFTVVTERLIDDRNLDTLKDVLKNTAGITFLAPEGGEEDIRLRGSASMLFGRGSTGGAVNQVNKFARTMEEHQIDVTVGNHAHLRLVGDFNLRLGEEAALRMGRMLTQTDNNGSGSAIDKSGIAATP
jgi:catecholate siderophore receptor